MQTRESLEHDPEKAAFASKPLDWDGPDDPDDPKNWALAKKLFNTVVPAIFAFLVTFTTSTYVPGIPLVMRMFDVSRTVATLGLSLYTFAIALGPLITAPLSEMLGRKPVYISTMGMLIAFMGGAGAAQNIQTLLICRFLAGFLGSSAVAVGAGSVADIWDLSKDGGPASLAFIMGPFLGPVLGYLTGAYVITGHDNNWRWSAWIILIVGAPIFLSAFLLSESSKPRIIARRLRKSGKAMPETNHVVYDILPRLATAVVRPLHMMFTEPTVAYISVYTGFTFAMLFSFFGSYSFVFSSVYHFNSREVGLTFIGMLPGFLMAVATFGFFDRTAYAKARHAAGGHPAPEHRLYAAMFGSVLMPIGLFWFAWTARESVHWIVPVLSGIPFGWGMLSIFLSATTYLVDVYQSSTGASAIAANGILRYMLGGAFPLFTVQMYEGIGIGWAGSVFAFVSVLLLPVPWAFFKYGKTIRARSGYDTNRN